VLRINRQSFCVVSGLAGLLLASVFPARFNSKELGWLPNLIKFLILIVHHKGLGVKSAPGGPDPLSTLEVPLIAVPLLVPKPAGSVQGFQRIQDTLLEGGRVQIRGGQEIDLPPLQSVGFRTEIELQVQDRTFRGRDGVDMNRTLFNDAESFAQQVFPYFGLVHAQLITHKRALGLEAEEAESEDE